MKSKWRVFYKSITFCKITIFRSFINPNLPALQANEKVDEAGDKKIRVSFQS